MKTLHAALAKFVTPVALALALTATLASPAQAQDRPAPRTQRVVREEPRTVRVQPVIEVVGNVQRPRAFYVIPRRRPAPEERDLRTGRLRETVRSVERAPF